MARGSNCERALLQHNVRPDHIPHCHACQPDKPLRSPKVGEEIKVCLRCAQCGNIYHAGGRYHYHPPRARKNQGIQPGPNNSLINFDKWNAKGKYFSLYGMCRAEGRDIWQYRSTRNWSGICRTHRPIARQESDDIPHSSGAVVHRAERFSEDGQRKRMMKVAFTCANRKTGEHKGMAYLSTTKSDEWQGLCAECLKDRIPPTKLNGDEQIDGAWLLFSEEDEQGRIPILYDVCQHKRFAPRQTALSYRHVGKVSGVCLECRNNPAAFAERRVALALAEAGNEQKNERPDQRAFDAIATVWERVRGYENLTFSRRVKLVTGIEIAREMHLGTAGSASSADQLRDNLERWGIRDKYKGASQWLPRYVKDTIQELEQTRL